MTEVITGEFKKPLLENFEAARECVDKILSLSKQLEQERKRNRELVEQVQKLQTNLTLRSEAVREDKKCECENPYLHRNSSGKSGIICYNCAGWG